MKINQPKHGIVEISTDNVRYIYNTAYIARIVTHGEHLQIHLAGSMQPDTIWGLSETEAKQAYEILLNNISREGK